MEYDTIEVLAPAGSPEIARAVLKAGADAVYFAGNAYGARAYAPNFTRQEASDMLDLLHLHRKKAYLTVNTLLKNTEIERQLYDDLRFYYEAGVDAVLVQDFGVLMLLREYFPDWPVHASTQMNIVSHYGANFLTEYGVKRIVAARELSLGEIRMLCANSGAEIEVFVHGALCVCYSGQCLMSSFLGGRSGNRGRCAQPCRLPYRVLDGRGRKIKTPGDYMLSPKDLCGIADLPALIEAGVCSLKIEGRMKQAAYASTVTSLYRKYVDLYLEKGRKGYAVSEEDSTRLLASGSRNGFTNAYFFVHNTPKMMSFADSSHEKKQADLKEHNESVQSQKAKELLPDEKLPIGGHLTAKIGEPLALVVRSGLTAVTVFGNPCEQARKQPVSKSDLYSKLNKTGDSPFAFREMSIEMDENIFVPLKEINRLRREALDGIYHKLVSAYHRKLPLVPFLQMDSPNPDIEAEPAIFVRVLNEEQFWVAQKQPFVDAIILPVRLYQAVIEAGKDRGKYAGEHSKTVQKRQKRYIVELPVVLRHGTAETYAQFVKEHGRAEYEVSGYDALGFVKEMGISMAQIHAGYRLYMMSGRARDGFRRIGIVHGSVPLELSEKELSHRGNSTDRMLVYGRVPLMYTANCVAKNTGKCTKTASLYYLQDRKGKNFPVICDCAICTNMIYNAVPTDLTDKYREIAALRPEAVEIAFSTETGTEAEAVLKRVQKAIAGKNKIDPPGYEFTRGHFTKSIK